VQEVTLVLRQITGLEQVEAAFDLPQPSVVPGGDPLRAQGRRVIDKCLELDLGVAQDVRVGRAPGRVFGEEGAEYSLLVLGREIHDLQVDADDLGDRSAVDQVLPRRAVLVIVVVFPVLHE